MDSKIDFAALKEGRTIECKKASGKIPESFYQTYSAFGNTSGGIVYLGVEETDGKFIPTGVSNASEMAKNILYSSHNPEKVSVDLLDEDDVKIIEIEGKKIIEVKIREAKEDEKPVYINNSLGFSYKRKGDADMLLGKEEIHHYLSHGSTIRKDVEVNTKKITPSSLNDETIEAYKREFVSYHGEKSVEGLDKVGFLKKIGAMIDDGDGNFALTNGAILFFGDYSDILRIYPYYFVDYRRYDQTESERWAKRIVSGDFSFSGNIYDFFRLSRSDIRGKLPNPFYREDGANLDGKDIFDAVCEGMANALSNTDFSLSGGTVFVMKENSFAFRNAGRMRVSIAQALNGGLSRPFNEGIMNFFRYINVVEKTGSGIPKILSAAKRYGYRSPTLKEDAENLSTELVFSFLPLPKGTPSRPLKEKIISLLSEKGEEMSVSEIAEALSVSHTQVVNLTRELIVAGILKDNGKPRKGRKLSLAE